MSTTKTLTEARALLTKGGSVVTATEQALSAANDQKDLNAFLELFQETALEQAARVDAKLKAGDAGPLAGLVISIKDNICYKGHRVSAGSRILEGFTSLYSATVVERLLAADAVILGRTNCDEFAMGSSNENSYRRTQPAVQPDAEPLTYGDVAAAFERSEAPAEPRR